MGIWIAAIVVSFAVLALMVYFVGARLPEEHSAEASALIPNQSPSAITARIRDVEHSGSWRRGVSAVVLTRNGSSITFTETGPNGVVTYRQTQAAPDAQIVNEMLGDGLPYGGTWTIQISPAENGSLVAIREDGFVKPPLFRCIARFIFGYSGSIKRYLQELAAAQSV